MELLLDIEALAAGGDGLARADGRVIFVPGTAPGDRVRAAAEPSRGGAGRARLLEVLSPGEARVPPPCPAASTCGGCQWQHVAPAAQEKAKAELVADALRRIGGFTAPPLRPLVPSPLAMRYRRRLRVRPTPDGWGLTRRASHDAVPLTACLLVEEPVERLLGELAGALREVRGFGAIESFTADAAETGEGAAHLVLAAAPSARVLRRAEALLAAVPRLRGVVLSGGEPARLSTVGDPVLVDPSHHRLRVRPDLFAQANRLGARQLAKLTAETVAPGTAVLELYAGAGTLSLALVERAASLVASEGEGPSLELLRSSLAENGREARLIAGPAARVAGGLAAEGRRFDHVVLDPPRTGAPDVTEHLARLAPERITYVSCDPATFSRDAARLARAGYRLESVTPVDLFPHTFHVEVLAVLVRE